MRCIEPIAQYRATWLSSAGNSICTYTILRTVHGITACPQASGYRACLRARYSPRPLALEHSTTRARALDCSIPRTRRPLEPSIPRTRMTSATYSRVFFLLAFKFRVSCTVRDATECVSPSRGYTGVTFVGAGTGIIERRSIRWQIQSIPWLLALLVTITQFPEPAHGQLWKIPRLTTTPSIRSCPCPTPPCTLMRHPNGLCGGKALGSWTLEDTLMDHSDVGVFAYAKTWPRRRITCRYVSAGSLCRSSGWYSLVRLPGVDFTSVTYLISSILINTE